MKEKKEFYEYEDAPSGAIKLYNYKEPLMPYKTGYGFQGVLMVDANGSSVQCHFCGNWFDKLFPHIWKEHKLTAPEYKREVGLFESTALVSESYRMYIVATRSSAHARLRKETPEQRNKRAQAIKRAKNSMEAKNNYNTCPEQLITRLINLSIKLGRTPTTKEVPFMPSIYKTYGTYENILEKAGLKKNKSGIHTHDRLEMAKKALATKIANGQAMTKEQILEDINNFYKVNKQYPTWSDFERRLLNTTYNRVVYRFGNLPKAIEKAKNTPH